jgi:hypothetical protein
MLEQSLNRLLNDRLIYELTIARSPLLAFDAYFVAQSSETLLFERLTAIQNLLRGLTQNSYALLVTDDFLSASGLVYAGQNQHGHFTPINRPPLQRNMHGHGSSYATYNHSSSYYASGYTSFQPHRGSVHEHSVAGQGPFENSRRGPDAPSRNHHGRG